LGEKLSRGCQNRPLFIHGDSPWSAIVQLHLAGEPGVTSTNTWDYYLADRQAKGFHAVIVSALENQFCKEPPKDVLGQLPFNAIPAGTDRFAFRMPDAQDWIVVLRAR